MKILRKILRQRVVQNTLLTLITTTLLAFSALTHADEVSGGISVYLSPKGQRLLTQNFEEFLFINGTTLRRGSFPGFKYISEDPIKLDDLSPGVAWIRTFLEKALPGFRLNDPKLEVQIESVKYQAAFNRFSITPEIELSKVYGLAPGSVFSLEIEAKELMLSVQKIKVTDLNNLFLGNMGTDEIKIKLLQVPLKLKVTVGFSNPQIEIINIKHNFDEIKIATSFARPLQLPRFEIKINDQSFGLNPVALEDELEKHMPAISQLALDSIKLSLDKNMRATITNTIAEFFGKLSAEVNELDVPPLPSLKSKEKLQWTIKPEAISLNDRHLKLQFAGQILDPQSKQKPTSPNRRRTDADLSKYPIDQYDIALGVDQAIVNQLLSALFNRGGFDAIAIEESDPKKKPGFIKFNTAPTFELTSNPTGSTTRIHVDIETQIKGLGTIFVKNPAKLSFDVIVESTLHSDNSFTVSLKKIDLDSVLVDPSCIRFSWFSELVKNKVEDTFKKLNTSLLKKPIVIIDKLPMPPTVAGLAIEVKKIEFQNSGNIVLYLNYGEIE